jgi:predicted DNA-binding transcriptional regulator YafY
VIAGACRRPQRLAFRYTDRDGAATRRAVEPHRLVHTGRRWYLVARDLDRAEWRSFRVDRMSALEATGVRFDPSDPPDAAAFVANAVTTAPYRYHARVVVRAPAPVIAERVPPTVGALEPAGPDSCLLTAGSDSLDALGLHLGMLDADFRVLAPPELIERLRELAGRLARAAD